MDNINSLLKKMKNLKIRAYKEGKKNFKENKLCVELKAKERAEICAKCEFSVREPIRKYQVPEERISSVRNKSCGACGCILSYLIRQDIKKCKLGKW